MRHLKIVLLAAALAALAAPATASAWKVTVHVHGAGKVAETTPAGLMDCTVSTTGRSNASTQDCVAGASGGGYGHGWIVELAASVPSSHHDRGWRFSKWVDGNTGGRVNCDPQPDTGDHTSTACRFQIFQDLEIDLYFVDVQGPQDTAISSGPPSPTRLTSASFAFDAASDPDAGYQCSLDRPATDPGEWYTCGSTSDKGESFSSLAANGQYTFRVRGRDPSGNVDATPATWTWTVDTVPPTPTITGGPAQGSVTNQTSATFQVGTNEGTVACALNGAPTPCGVGPKTVSGLTHRVHTFAVSATDAAGNTRQVIRSWSVDLVAPAPPTITAGPSGTVASRTPAFSYESEAGATFECSLDGQAFEPCGASKGYVGLADGAHTFSVRATDVAGNTGTPSEQAWTIDATAPAAPAVTSGPARFARSALAVLSFTGEADATFVCSLDGAAPAPCPSPVAYAGLANGVHTFSVSAVDAVGNVSEPTTRSWTVDTKRPQTTIKAKPRKRTAARRATFRFVASEKPATFRCKLDRGAWKACKSGKTYKRLRPGKHTFRVRAKDRAGNVDATAAAYTWRVRRR